MQFIYVVLFLFLKVYISIPMPNRIKGRLSHCVRVASALYTSTNALNEKEILKNNPVIKPVLLPFKRWYNRKKTANSDQLMSTS